MFRSSYTASCGSGFTGLIEMFSLKAVERRMLLTWSTFNGSKGSVSDLFMRFQTGGPLDSTGCSFETLCFLFDAASDGRRLDGRKAGGRRE